MTDSPRGLTLGATAVRLVSFLGRPAAQIWLAVLLLLSLTILPFVLLGQNAYVPEHDNLDSEFVYIRNLVVSGSAFDLGSSTELDNVMNGLPRSTLRSGYNATVVLFSLFHPFTAYVVNALLVRLVAFVGMLLLLRRHILPSERDRSLNVCLALLFALLPFYMLFGLSVAGQPLFFWAYANILRRINSWKEWLVIALFPLYSALYLVGISLVCVLGINLLLRSLSSRKVDWRALVPVIVLGVGYLLVEWPMLQAAFLDSSWVSHRVEFDVGAFPSDKWAEAKEVFLRGHGHASTLHVLPILLALALACRELVRTGKARQVGFLSAAILLIIAFHLSYSFLTGSTKDYLPLLSQVQFDRFYFFLPLLWFALLAFALSAVRAMPRLRLVVVPLLLVQGLFILRYNLEVRRNLAILAGFDFHPTFAEFFDPPLFESIQAHIGEPPERYRVVGLGLHPAVLQYNGFYTLDGYQNNYPLSYKHQFRRIIEQELEKDGNLRIHFDAWGNRCYVFSSELGNSFLWGKEIPKEIEELSIDTRALHDLGGRFILAAVPIQNAAELQLLSHGSFEHPRSFWRIHLYEVRP